MSRNIPRPCPECGGNDLWMTLTNARGWRGPDLLPGLGGLLRPTPMHVVLCRECGLVRFFATQSAMDRVRSSKEWGTVPPEPPAPPNPNGTR